MDKEIGHLVNEMGTLAAVRIIEFEPNWIEALHLEFEYATIDVGLNADTDTISIEGARASNQNHDAITSPPLWSDILSSRVRWAWRLTNHRGFEDGVQFEFAKADSTIGVQIMVEASRLWIYRLEPFEQGV